MNLLKDPWLTFKFVDGHEEVLPLSAIVNPDIIDFSLPRADFHGAAYQFMIGILQTIFSPADIDEWIDYYEQPPSQHNLQNCLKQAEHAFNVTGNAPLFMQDFDDLMDAKLTPISGLLIEAPGENTIKNNIDHFVKRGIGEEMSLEMAVLALFTLQINAPSGGQGHRVGLRGGGPLTTLIQPNPAHSSLWHKVWMNIMSTDFSGFPQADLFSSSVFPWLEKTKTSEQEDSGVYANEVHPLHMYWAMPRRIRLCVDESQGMCQISGKLTSKLVRKYRTKNRGYNYSGPWSHPLTPYKWNPAKPDEYPLSLKGKPGGITYKIWDNLTLSNSKEGQSSAMVVRHYYRIAEELKKELIQLPQLWVFGYDMDNMQARAWHNNYTPIFQLAIRTQNELLQEVKFLQTLASEALTHSKKYIKEAWFTRPKEVTGDLSFIDAQFWQKTEAVFYETVAEMVKSASEIQFSPHSAKHWLDNISQEAIYLFDHHALEFSNASNMAQRVNARLKLRRELNASKLVKSFRQAYNIQSNT